MYFGINYLSFQSINISRMFTEMAQCSVHGAYDRQHLEISKGQAGYTVSYFYRELDRLAPDGKFILFREDHALIEDHLMLGIYHGIFNPRQLYDLYTYWDIKINDHVISDLRYKIEGYYNSVRGYFHDKQNFLEVDLTPFDGNFESFILSNEFVNMGDWMGLPLQDPLAKIADMQNNITSRKIFPYVNYLTSGSVLSVPKGYPMNTLIGGGLANMVSPKFKNKSYIEYLQRDLQSITPTTQT